MLIFSFSIYITSKTSSVESVNAANAYKDITMAIDDAMSAAKNARNLSSNSLEMVSLCVNLTAENDFVIIVWLKGKKKISWRLNVTKLIHWKGRFQRINVYGVFLKNHLEIYRIFLKTKTLSFVMFSVFQKIDIIKLDQFSSKWSQILTASSETTENSIRC